MALLCLTPHDMPVLVPQEEFFMEQSVEKAISIDEWTGETLSSSMVDDVFYILRMCSYRALDTANLQALTAVLGQLNSLLATNLAHALEQRWKVPVHAFIYSFIHSFIHALDCKVLTKLQQTTPCPLSRTTFVTCPVYSCLIAEGLCMQRSH